MASENFELETADADAAPARCAVWRSIRYRASKGTAR
jgi:hypothetical protein